MILNFKPSSLGLSFICLFFCFSAFGQDKKFSINIELSPNISKMTNEFVASDSKYSFNGLVRLEYQANNRISPTVGIGYLNTGERSEVAGGGQLGIQKINFIYSHNYIIIPFGAKFHLGEFFIHPEIGPGLNISNKTKTIFNYTNGEQEVETGDSNLISGEYNKISLPVFLSIGREFNLANKIFSIGIKGYYGLNNITKDVPRNSHYYGVGILFGLKF